MVNDWCETVKFGRWIKSLTQPDCSLPYGVVLGLFQYTYTLFTKYKHYRMILITV